ncbi:SDR family NAD(P)-dependent oxidoreductase [Sphingopyxis sp. PET50]|uniref:SDR family NAD(P)-dependent oxidoreductase n=1 Tax=Sphingopyxis sp. PET50 TaxID=2976533 RepID=UPI0021AFB5CD|nr:SDR family oxidoreductase [Sphingopyxis sp. PET50]
MTRVGRLRDKVAVVTGGASGIGLAVVERFVAEGARLVFCDLAPEAGREMVVRLGEEAARLHHSKRAAGGPNDGAAIAERLGPAAIFMPADVTDEASLGAVIGRAVDEFGGLDILVNNAGVGGPEGALEKTSDAIFDRMIGVNLRGPWLGIKLAFPHLKARGGGSIVTTSSISALVGMAGQTTYGAAKAGVLQMSRVAAIEGAASFIRVNSVCPGGIVTPLIYENPLIGLELTAESISAAFDQAQPIPRA